MLLLLYSLTNEKRHKKKAWKVERTQYLRFLPKEIENEKEQGEQITNNNSSSKTAIKTVTTTTTIKYP